MSYKMIVLVKQVPDTKAVTGKAMNPDGTVNRAVLPAIFNPEDRNALEEALRVRETHGGNVAVLTMGLPKACDVLREALFLGADEVALLTDRKCAGSDTLATSYILSCAVRHLGPFDIVFCGQQAIDGDTAQVGPQTAEKLGITQITYLQAISDLAGEQLVVRRATDEGYEVVAGKLPVLLTVTEAANEVRSPAAKRIMAFKKARAVVELTGEIRDRMPDASAGEVEAAVKAEADRLASRGLLIRQLSAAEIGAEDNLCGWDGSPTKVKRIQSVVLSASAHKKIDATDEGIHGLVSELIEEHAIG